MNRPLPDVMLNAPTLEEGLYEYFEAFWDLVSCRNSEGGSIPWLAIKAYADELQYEGDERECLFHHIRELDDTYMAHQIKSKAP